MNSRSQVRKGKGGLGTQSGVEYQRRHGAPKSARCISYCMGGRAWPNVDGERCYFMGTSQSVQDFKLNSGNLERYTIRRNFAAPLAQIGATHVLVS